MLEINNVSKSLGNFTLSDITLIVSQEYHILLGESGAGKSVLLEIIAGLTTPDKGIISLNGKDITGLPVSKRRTGLIFQSPALFPNLDVSGNIGYPLNKLSKAEKTNRVNELAEQMGIQHLLKQRISTLSGGEMQRVALARIIASNPLILLLDEPLSAIDASLKSNLRKLLRDLNKNGMPILHVTHDFEEAVALGERISVIEKGKILQTGSLNDVINNPKSSFSADFIGERNFYKANIENNQAVVNNVKSNKPIKITLGEEYSQSIANILIRSRAISIITHEPELSNMNNFAGVISAIVPHKHGLQVCIDIGVDIYAHITPESCSKLGLSAGQVVWATFKASQVEVIL